MTLTPPSRDHTLRPFERDIIFPLTSPSVCPSNSKIATIGYAEVVEVYEQMFKAGLRLPLNPLHRHSARSAAIGLTRVALHPGPNAAPSAVTSRPLVFGIRASDRSCAPLVEVRDLALLWLRRAPFRGACFRTFRQGAPSHPSRTRVQEEVTPDIGLRPSIQVKLHRLSFR